MRTRLLIMTRERISSSSWLYSTRIIASKDVSAEVHKVDVSDIMRHLVKEQLYTAGVRKTGPLYLL